LVYFSERKQHQLGSDPVPLSPYQKTNHDKDDEENIPVL